MSEESKVPPAPSSEETTIPVPESSPGAPSPEGEGNDIVDGVGADDRDVEYLEEAAITQQRRCAAHISRPLEE